MTIIIRGTKKILLELGGWQQVRAAHVGRFLDRPDRGATAVIEIAPDVRRHGPTTIVGFTTSTPERGPLSVQFELEGQAELSERAVTEAMMIASIALAMQQRCVLRVHGNVSRSLRHSIDLYQEACAFWWPQRYQKVAIEVGVVEDQPPTTARGILCFSGGLDSTFSAHCLGGAGQVEAGLLIQGYDIDISSEGGLRHQRNRVTRLLSAIGLTTIVMRTNVRDVLGATVIEGAQGSYLAAAMTLLSNSFGRGFVSSDIWDLAELGYPGPLHEAIVPLLGSTRFPLYVYGGQVPRLEKLRELASHPDLFRDVRVCMGRRSDQHCGRCSKCLLNSFACVALTGEWPPWLARHQLDLSGLAKIPPTEQYRLRYAREILQLAASNGVQGDWVAALAQWLAQEEAGPRRSARQFLRDRLPPPLRRQASRILAFVRRLAQHNTF